MDIKPNTVTIKKLDTITIELTPREAFILMTLIGSHSASSVRDIVNQRRNKSNISNSIRGECTTDEGHNNQNLYERIENILADETAKGQIKV